MHWIFHKYKWETYHTVPVFVIGFFQDYVLELRFQTGSCECGSFKVREIYINPLQEIENRFIDLKIKAAKKAKESGDIETAIEILKI